MNQQATFKFNLKQVVKITESDESGTVIGRAEYAESMQQYFVRYKSADGRAVEVWWTEAALAAV